MSLQEELDYFKTHKAPDKTLFGAYERYARPKQWQSHDNATFQYPQGKSGAFPVVDRLPKYVRLSIFAKSVSELLGKLAQALNGEKFESTEQTRGSLNK